MLINSAEHQFLGNKEVKTIGILVTCNLKFKFVTVRLLKDKIEVVLEETGEAEEEYMDSHEFDVPLTTDNNVEIWVTTTKSNPPKKSKRKKALELGRASYYVIFF